MDTKARIFATIVFFCLLGLPAHGAVLNWAGTATVHLYPHDDVNPKFTGGGVATVNGTSGVIPYHLDEIRLDKGRGGIEGSTTYFITDPETAGLGMAAVRYLDMQGLTGTLGGSFPTGRSPGAMGVRGLVRVCLLSTACTTYAPLALTQPTTVSGVPGGEIKGLGVGGLLTIGGYGDIRISVQMAPWTIKTVTGRGAISTEHGAIVPHTWTMRGWVHGPMSSSSSTAAVGGEMLMVTPAAITSNTILGFAGPDGAKFSEAAGSVVSVMIRFIPEPNKGVLILCGVAFLIALSHTRRR